MFNVRRVAFVGALMVVLIAGWMIKAKFFPAKAPPPVTAAAKLSDIEETVLASGTLKPIKMVAVGAQVSGRVISLKVKIGDKVKLGDLIAQIDPITKQNDLRTAEAALQNMRAQRDEKEATLALAQSTLARNRLTVAQKATPRADFDTAVATVKQTEAQIAALDAQITQAEVSVANARVNLDYTKVTAPIEGTVLAVVTQEGQTVNAVQSAPTIVILGQVEVMTIRAEISEVDVIKVKPGQEVYFNILGDPDHRYSAQLDFIEPAPESIKNDSSFSSTSVTSSSSAASTSTSAIYYNAIFTAPNSDGRLRTYMTAEVHVVVAQAHQALTIPSAALTRRNPDGSYLVEVVGVDGTVSSRSVKIGINNKLMAQVLSGLAAGDNVVLRRTTGDAQPSSGGSDAPPPRM
ncbi:MULTISPECIES: efflux RND transporter periplasmic adaptor subunit [Rhodopseudomonas]|uniref:Hemolysin secretion protein D n=1 Tax=Rhodopseudomonas palustris TaxID=1076 RepID=A0A0D7EFG3_RHOPL|nr:MULTISPECIES: efflux RND transporter periplasmic adaptor subunit [Rhodopseudomonas]KIZ39250.1 hemolysin secretion protein D [Rhodopseudomonas palustris]MDF3814351.1 efflux RND transporter periplasmic adaptor subunit [Rhodopseudomonas sp. BAL398]WOK18047.1 efflux RND transporter periplasmic adaptor subunit [Rhodopseudomonas sp. BAL398]